MQALTYLEIDVPSFVPTSPETIETFRFAIDSGYLPLEIDAIPSLASLNITPVTVSLGENLGERASITASFVDHRHRFASEAWEQGTFWSKWRGRYGTKLRGRPLRIIRGTLGDTLEAMEVRHFMIESTDGPTPAGVYTITAQDYLKLADDDRSQAPLLSEGSLAGSLTNVATAATLSPTGIGNSDYPSSGWVCIGGNEICSFTRSNDALTLTRAQLGSVASAHDAGSRVQIVLRYDGDDVADIIHDLLTNYAGVDPAFIDLPTWQAETAANLGVIYARTITEPTAVKDLVASLIAQSAIAIWWDDLAQLVRLQVLKEIATDAAVFNEDTIVEGSLQVVEQPGKRISQVWTYFNQRDPTDQSDEADNYAAASIGADLVLQEEYGSPEIRKLYGSWIGTEAAAERLSAIQLSRFGNPPRRFAFTIFGDRSVTLGGGYQLGWRFNTDEGGVEVLAPIQVTRVRREADLIHVEAEEMLASGEIPALRNVVFLRDTGGVLSWVVPASWNDADNFVDCIGAGAGGANAFSSGGMGGGGGAWSRKNNIDLTPGASVSYRVGVGGAGGTGFANGGDGGDTWFGNAVFASALCGARGGDGGISRSGGGFGGQAADGIGDSKNSGGSSFGGGVPSDSGRAGGGGGGGAAGANGNGAAGGRGENGSDGGGGGGADGGNGGAFGNDGGAGGNNRYGFGGGNSSTPAGDEGGGGQGGPNNGSGGPGGAGEQFYTQTVSPIISAGPGGGGGGGGDDGNGGPGGSYGGGGGGSGGDSDATGGSGAQGIIIISWSNI